MKLRAAVSVLALIAAVSACSSSGKSGGASVGDSVVPTTGGSVGVGASTPAGPGGTGSSGDFCADLTQAQTKLSGLGSAASGGDFNALKAAIDQEITAFQDLGNGAPAEVKPSIDDIVSVLQQAEGAFSNPASPDLAKLQALSTKLPSDLTALTTYVSTKCTGS